MTKKRIILTLLVSGMVMLTGCSGPVWNAMKEQGRELQKQGRELHQQLESEAKEVNSSVGETIRNGESNIK